MQAAAKYLCVGLALASCGCSPSFNWRSVRIAGTQAVAHFPCRPATTARGLQLAGIRVDWTVLVCTTEGMTFAVGTADMADPARAAEALLELARSARRNVASAAVVIDRPALVPGLVPNGSARLLHVRGRRSDGVVIDEHVLLFMQGSHVFQATVLGRRLTPDAVATFQSSVKVAS